MGAIDTRPQIVDIDHYAGDTLTLHVKVPDSVIAGRVWSAQIRSRRDSTKVDATFVIIPVAGVGADVVLSTAESRRLTSRGMYNGFWDVQLSLANGADPVTTLAHGEIRLHPDVTRVATT